jgi:hypothetical protein
MDNKPWEYDGRIIALTRNVEMLGTALNHYEKMRAADAKRVEDLMMTVTQMTQQVQQLNQKVALLQAQGYEAGIR